MSTRKDQILRRMSGKKGRAVALTREEKALRDVAEMLENGVSGGAQPDLSQNDPNAPDYVKNRTHYVGTTVVNEPLNITWDGNTEGLVSVGDFYKISDIALSDEHLKTCTILMHNEGATFPLVGNWEEAVEWGDVLLTEEYTVVDPIVVIHKVGAEYNGVVFSEVGVYTMDTPVYYTITTTEPIEQTKTVVKKLDKQFLPDNVGVFEVELDWDTMTVVTPLNKIRDAWEKHIPMVIYAKGLYDNSMSVYTFNFGATDDNGNFDAAEFYSIAYSYIKQIVIDTDGSFTNNWYEVSMTGGK